MWAVARVLPPAAASRLGGSLLAAAGPLLRKHRQVLGNLHHARPEASPAELRRLARAVWRNLGAVLFEYPHLEHVVNRRTGITMPDSVRRLFDSGQPVLVMTAHLANWEVIGSWLSRQAPGIVVVYSPSANPRIEAMIQGFRTRGGGEFVPKQEALRRLTGRFVAGRSIGLLPDVRVDSAPSLPLFGADAPTTISPARLAARLGYPVVPMRAKRLGPARFEIEVEEPLTARAPGAAKQTALDVMCQFNRRLEGWISERPGEWMCTKRRWPRVS